MTTVSSSTQAQATNYWMYNPYLAMSQASMANDFFGSQAFGGVGVNGVNVNNNSAPQANVSNVVQTTTAPQPTVVSQTPQTIEGSGSLASALLQQYLGVNGANGVNVSNNSAPQTGVSDVVQTTTAPQPTTPAQPTTTTNPTKTAPTMQDYYIATQIANSFANSTPMVYNPSGFTQNDFFAQQYFNPTNKQVINYTA